MSELDRVRWHCRRGMLELDLVLNVFVERHLAKLDPRKLNAFRALLEKPDPELLDFVMGRDEPADTEERAVMALMRRPLHSSVDSLTPGPSPGGRGEIRAANG